MLGAAQVLSFTTLIMMFFGAIAGIIAAAIPGFTVTMAIVLTLLALIPPAQRPRLEPPAPTGGTTSVAP